MARTHRTSNGKRMRRFRHWTPCLPSTANDERVISGESHPQHWLSQIASGCSPDGSLQFCIYAELGSRSFLFGRLTLASKPSVFRDVPEYDRFLGANCRRSPSQPAAVTPTPRRSGTDGVEKSGNSHCFLTGRQFESQDCAGPLMAIACGGVPLRRRQAVAKCFRWDAAPRPAWRVEGPAVHQGEAAILGPPKVSVSSLLETFDSTETRRFAYRDGGLGRLWLAKCRAETNRQPSVRKRNNCRCTANTVAHAVLQITMP